MRVAQGMYVPRSDFRQGQFSVHCFCGCAKSICRLCRQRLYEPEAHTLFPEYC